MGEVLEREKREAAAVERKCRALQADKEKVEAEVEALGAARELVSEVEKEGATARQAAEEADRVRDSIEEDRAFTVELTARKAVRGRGECVCV